MGGRTAEQLAAAGVRARVPEQPTSEGLLALPALSTVAGARVLLVCGEGGRGELAAPVDDQDDGLGFFEGDAGLAEDFRGDEGFVIGDDAAGVDEARGTAVPLDLAVDAVAGDAGLVADDGAARLGEAVEKGGFAHIGASHDGEGGHGAAIACEGLAERVCHGLACFAGVFQGEGTGFLS